MAADDAGPLERAWLSCGFRIRARDYFRIPKVMEDEGDEEGRSVALFLPTVWAADADLREVGIGYGIARLFFIRYGVLMLIRGILAWPRLVEGMALRDRETAAD